MLADSGPFQEPITFVGDEGGYWLLANRLAETNFTRYRVLGDISDQARLPVVPALIAVVIKVFGAGHGFFKAWTVLQLIEYSLAIGLVISLIRRMGLLISLPLAGFFACLDLITLWNATRLLTEATFVLTFTACFCSLPLGRNEQSTPRGALLTGVLLALSVLTRPIALFFVLPTAGILWLKSRQIGPRRFFAVGLMLLIYALPIGAWGVRNKVVHDKFFLSEISKVNLCFYWGAQAEADRTGESFEDVRARYFEEFEAALGHDMTNAPLRQEFMTTKAIEALSANPTVIFSFPPHAVYQIFWGRATSRMNVLYDQRNVGIKGHLSGGTPIVFIILVWGELIALLSVYGLVAFAVFRAATNASLRMRTLLLLLPVAYLLALSWGPEATARFRIPMMPWLVGLAAVAPFLLVRPAQRIGDAERTHE